MKQKAKDKLSYHIEYYGKKNMDIFATFPRLSRVKTAVEMIKSEMRKNKRNLKILDIGCNDGSISKLMQDLGNKIYGIDIVPILVKEARSKGIEAKVGDAEDGLPFSKNSFDIVYAGEVIEHIYDTEFFLREIRRVLKDDGVLIITTPNIASLPNRIRLFFGLYPKGVAEALSRDGLGGHIRVFTKAVLKKLLESNGFKVEKIVSNMVCFSPTKCTSLPWSTFLGKIFPGLGETLILKARVKNV